MSGPEVLGKALTVAVKSYTVADGRPWRCRTVRGTVDPAEARVLGLADSVGGVLDVGELL